MSSMKRVLPLSQREKQVLKLASEGLTDKMIAEALGMSPTTPGTYMTRIRHKLGASSRTEAVATFARLSAEETETEIETLHKSIELFQTTWDEMAARNERLEVELREKSATLRHLSTKLEAVSASLNQLERSLCMHEDILESTFEAATSCLALLDANLVVVRVSQGWAFQFGKSRDSFVGQPIEESLPDALEDKSHLIGALYDASQCGFGPSTVAKPFTTGQCLSGANQCSFLNVRPIPDRYGQTEFILVSCAASSDLRCTVQRMCN